MSSRHGPSLGLATVAGTRSRRLLSRGHRGPTGVRSKRLRRSWAARQPRSGQAARRSGFVRLPVSAHFRRQVPRLQGLPGGRDDRPSAPARGGPAGGARGGGRPARDQHVLHHRRGRGEVAPVGPAVAALGPRGLRGRLRRQPRRGPVRLHRRGGEAVHRHRRGRRGRDGRRGGARLRRSRVRRAHAAARAGHPNAWLRQGAGRLRLPLRVLHHPHGPRRAPARVRRARCSTRFAAVSARASPRW